MLLQSAHLLLKEEYLDLGTALLLSLFTRLLLAGGPCCLAAFPGARSEMKAEVSLLYNRSHLSGGRELERIELSRSQNLTNWKEGEGFSILLFFYR